MLASLFVSARFATLGARKNGKVTGATLLNNGNRIPSLKRSCNTKPRKMAHSG